MLSKQGDHDASELADGNKLSTDVGYVHDAER